jgi:crotonobetainyl-CoA:carnitine CoA-transferase CaiB-like acyl-CoA transferase
MEAFIGHTLLRAYRDLGPMATTPIYPSDAFAGLNGTFATLAALHHRRRTGEGQLIEVPQAEAAIALLAEAVLDCSLNGRVAEPIENRDIHGAAPQGVYPCAGEDRWIAITVAGDEQWRALCEVLGSPAFAADERFATAAGRREWHDEIDATLPELTSKRDQRELFLALQARGVAAGPVMTAADCYADPHLAARGFFERIYHEDTGVHDWPGQLFKMSRTELKIRRPPPGLGEHNDYVYREPLGYSAGEYERLRAQGHIATEFDPEVP